MQQSGPSFILDAFPPHISSIVIFGCSPYSLLPSDTVWYEQGSVCLFHLLATTHYMSVY